MNLFNRSNHKYAVRIYSGKLKIDNTETLNGKKFFLLNLPFYLTGNINFINIIRSEL